MSADPGPGPDPDPGPADRAARLLAEVPKSERDRRTPSARDRARVLHSAALRRLAGKTQVVGPGEDADVTGVPRTRLTHSLEVAQIGRGIAEDLGSGRGGPDADTVDTAGLAHDIGHPPFGHNGERALDEAAAGCGGFEGNAQTLRLLTRLEPKTLDDERCRGLNLSRGVLDACIKYPWPRSGAGPTVGTGPVDGTGAVVGTGTGGAGAKFGVYADDAEVFAWIRAGVTPGRRHARCVEAQIMDWADDVAYSVHDVEDAVLAGRMSLATLAGAAGRAELTELALESAGSGPAGPGPGALTTADLDAAGRRLADLAPVVAAVAQEPGSLAASVALKRLTSELVGRFVSAAVEATLPGNDGPGDGVLAPGHGSDLVVPRDARAEVALLKAAALRWVMRDPARLAQQARQRALLGELVERLDRAAPRALDPAFVGAWEAAVDDAGRRRVVVDQVATLTDAQAVAWHGRLRAEGGAGS